MTLPRLPLDIEHVVKLYRDGHPMRRVATLVGSTESMILRALIEAGVERRAPWCGVTTRIQVDIPDIVRRYEAGESTNRIANSLGVSRNVIDRRLKRAGVTLRGQSEAERVKWAQMTPGQRRRQVAPAHEAVRGQPISTERLIALAKCRERNHLTRSPNERRMEKWLVERGVSVAPQQRVGTYNCDLGAFPVAVEIWGGHWHFNGRHRARFAPRLRYFFDAGWHMISIVVTSTHPLERQVTDEVIALLEFARRHPSATREHRMIGGAGHHFATLRADADDLSLVCPLGLGKYWGRRGNQRVA